MKFDRGLIELFKVQNNRQMLLSTENKLNRRKTFSDLEMAGCIFGTCRLVVNPRTRLRPSRSLDQLTTTNKLAQSAVPGSNGA